MKLYKSCYSRSVRRMLPSQRERIMSFPTVEKYLKEKQGFLVNKVSVKGLTLQKRRTLVVQRSALRPFPSVTDTDHVVLAPPALWFEAGADPHRFPPFYGNRSGFS